MGKSNGSTFWGLLSFCKRCIHHSCFAETLSGLSHSLPLQHWARTCWRLEMRDEQKMCLHHQKVWRPQLGHGLERAQKSSCTCVWNVWTKRVDIPMCLPYFLGWWGKDDCYRPRQENTKPQTGEEGRIPETMFFFQVRECPGSSAGPSSHPHPNPSNYYTKAKDGILESEPE